MKSIISIGPNFSGRAYKGTFPGVPIAFAAHEFRATADGRLAHYMDGRLCAKVPPEGFAEYVETWPDSRPVIEELVQAERSAAATLAAAQAAPAAEPDKLSGVDQAADLAGQDAPGA